MSDVVKKVPKIAGIDYLTMLKRAWSQLPENVKVPVDRLVIPDPDVRVEAGRTVISNWKEIVGVFRTIDPAILLRFILKRLGTVGAVHGTELYLQGIYTRVKLKRLLETFAKTYVICDLCGRPDCIIRREKRKWFKQCQACGASFPVEKV